MAQRGKFIPGICGFSSFKVSGTDPGYPNEGWTSPSWAVNSLKSVKPSKDEFSLKCLNPFFFFFFIHLLLYFLFLLTPHFWLFSFSLCFLKMSLIFFPFYISTLCVISYIVNVTWVNSAKYYFPQEIIGILPFSL